MTTADIPISGLSETEHSAQLRRALIASTVGTTIASSVAIAIRQTHGQSALDASIAP